MSLLSRQFSARCMVRTTKLIVLLAASAFAGSALSQSRGGFIVGTGGSLAANNVLYAREMLPSLIGSCISLREVCEVSSGDLVVLAKIADIARVYPADQSRVAFSSELRGTVFDHRTDIWRGLAKSGTSPGAPVVWNVDVLNGPVPPDLGSIIAIWVHELGHQAGENGPRSHQYLDSLGAKLKKLFENRLVIRLSLPYYPDAYLTAVNYAGLGGKGDLFVEYGLGSVRVTGLLATVASCPFAEHEFLGWRISNPRFLQPPPAYVEPGNSVQVRVGLWLELTCASGGRVVEPSPYQNVELSVDFARGEGGIAARPVRAYIPPPRNGSRGPTSIMVY